VNQQLFTNARASTPVSGFHGQLFAASMLAFVGLFVVGLLLLLAADVLYSGPDALRGVFELKRIQASLWLSLWTSGLTVLIGLALAVPMGYALSRYRFPGHALVDSMVDLPIILPPLVVGLSLLVFFTEPPFRSPPLPGVLAYWLTYWTRAIGTHLIFQPKGIVLCQLLVSASFGIRAVKLTFDGIDPRVEHVAMTLGCTRAGAFFRVALPMARRGIIVGGILIWTRAFGIFGPLMVFVGAVSMRTEVLPTTIYLEQSVGNIEVALAVAILMIVLATVGLVTVRIVGLRGK